MNKGDIVKHKLSKGVRMVIIDMHASTPHPINCRWYDEKALCYHSDYFVEEELILVKSREA